MTFNVRIDVPIDGENQFKYRLRGIIDFINKQKPDVIGFQEVNHNMLLSLHNQLNDYHYEGKSRDGNDEYNPIFYLKKFQLISTETYWYGKTPNIPSTKHPEAFFPRIFTTVKLLLEDKMYEVVNTHLSHVSHKARLDSLFQLVDYYLYRVDKVPFVLMGDFNAYPNEGLDKILSPYFNSCWNYYFEETKTFHNFTDSIYGLPIDYIFTDSKFKFENVTISREKYNNIYLSDHYPVFAIIKLI